MSTLPKVCTAPTKSSFGRIDLLRVFMRLLYTVCGDMVISLRVLDMLPILTRLLNSCDMSKQWFWQVSARSISLWL